MRTEQQALRVSLVAILIFSFLGITFGLISGSSAIVFDGVFSLMDAVMSVVSIFVAGLIARSAADSLSPRTARRFSNGFWHFEPLVLCVNSLLMMSVGSYALVQSVGAILSGGREIEFGPAIIYALLVLILTSAIAIAEHRANQRIGSALVAMDVKGWVMTGGVTGALLIAFGIGAAISGTRFEYLTPYVDPVVLAVVALALIPIPLSTLRKAVAEIALVTPPALYEESTRVAAEVCEREGFDDFRLSAAQQGRARQIEIRFQVPPGSPAQPLEHWDRIRNDVTDRLGDGDPNHWISVSFTSSHTVGE